MSSRLWLRALLISVRVQAAQSLLALPFFHLSTTLSYVFWWLLVWCIGAGRGKLGIFNPLWWKRDYHIICTPNILSSSSSCMNNHWQFRVLGHARLDIYDHICRPFRSQYRHAVSVRTFRYGTCVLTTLRLQLVLVFILCIYGVCSHKYSWRAFGLLAFRRVFPSVTALRQRPF